MLLVLLAVAVAVQLVVLYVPSGAGQQPFLGSDKVAHVLVFLAPVLVALLAGLRPAVVVGVFAAHAVASELVQAAFLPARSGDPADVLADLTGVALGVVIWRLVGRVAGGRAASRAASRAAAPGAVRRG
jgi:VanZ family protein